MQIRRAAALALVGWYVMYPPNGRDPIPDAKWVQFSRSFDSAAECEVGRTKMINGKGFFSNLGPYEEAELEKALALSQCVASDDPRLKKK
jgi:hypothetical protein